MVLIIIILTMSWFLFGQVILIMYRNLFAHLAHAWHPMIFHSSHSCLVVLPSLVLDPDAIQFS